MSPFGQLLENYLHTPFSNFLILYLPKPVVIIFVAKVIFIM